MSWLTPLGFLGLISLLALLLIYILKPNYQNRYISSTYVWKLSLKYKKNKLPINKLRNIFLIICQALALIMASLILAQPFNDNGTEVPKEEVIIIDASYSMMSKNGNTTRFERAITGAKREIATLFDENDDAKVSVIVAADKAQFLASRANKSMLDTINKDLDSLLRDETGNIKIDKTCTYGTGDIDGAITLSQEITSAIKGVKVRVFTDTNYIDSGRVEIVSVKEAGERNVAILDVRAVSVDNHFRIEIDVASYGANDTVDVFCDVTAADDGESDELKNLSLRASVLCESDKVTTFAFGYIPEDLGEDEEINVNIVENVKIAAFENIHAYVDGADALDEDNSFWLYGGNKPTIRIQYSSTDPNNFFATSAIVLRSQLGYRWNIEFVQLKADEEPALEGFDIYIFEHALPEGKLPTDGVVILANPDKVPKDASFRLGGEATNSSEISMIMGDAHPITEGVKADGITVTKLRPITSYDGFTPLLCVDNYPVMIAKNGPSEKIVVMSFSLNYSNLPLLLDFPLMMYNMFEYYIPSTITEHVFDVNEEVSFGSRSETLELSGIGVNDIFESFPAVKHFSTPGVYTAIQTPISGNEVTDSFYVKVPAVESNINYTEDSLANPIYYEKVENTFVDLIIYFAIALVALLFVEWWLNTREQYQIGKRK